MSAIQLSDLNGEQRFTGTYLGGIQYTTTTLTNAQIKSLPTTIREIVPAPGANKLIVPVHAFALLNASAGAYNSDTARSWQLCFPPTQEISGIVEPNTALANAYAQLFLFPPLSFAGAGDFLAYLTSGQGQHLSTCAELSLNIGDVFNGVSDYSLGHASNTLKVTVYYVIANV